MSFTSPAADMSVTVDENSPKSVSVYGAIASSPTRFEYGIRQTPPTPAFSTEEDLPEFVIKTPDTASLNYEDINIFEIIVT